jgi:hypothetical protein
MLGADVIDAGRDHQHDGASWRGSSSVVTVIVAPLARPMHDVLGRPCCSDLRRNKRRAER